ncbi:MAG: AAA family ATPase [Paracoccaceae bacterium]
MTLQRNSKRNQSLLDHQERPIEETILPAALHGLSRDDYVERFSLNDDGLREGGARIANAQGDLGQLLHAGVSGLTTIATTLEQMTAHADRFHKKGGRGTELKVAKDRLAEINQELRASRLTPERERTLAKAQDDAKEEFNLTDTGLESARLRQAALTAAQTWYDQAENIRQIDAKLAEFPKGPELPKGAQSAVSSLVATISEKSLRVAEAKDALETLKNTICGSPEDPLAEALAQELKQLDQLTFDNAPLLARATTAASDLDRRIADREAIGAKINEAVVALNIADAPVETLVLTADEVDDLARAAQAVVNLERDVIAAEAAATRARGQLDDAPPEPQDLSQLQATWDKWSAVADITLAKNAVATEQAQLVTAVAGLPATWADLVAAGLPARETLLDLAGALATASADLASNKAELEAKETAYELAQANRQTYEGTPATIDAIAIAETRRKRDAIWVEHRSTLSAETAIEFESAMHVDDDAQASFAAGRDARGQLLTACRDEAAARVLRDKARERLNSATEQHGELTMQAAAIASALGLASETSPAAFTDRRTALLQAAAIEAKVANAKTEFDIQSTHHSAALQDMKKAANTVEIDCADTDLPSRVQTALTLQDSVRQTWKRWTDAKRVSADLEQEATDATTDKEAAQKTLQSQINTRPLAGRTADEIIAALPNLRRLSQFHTEQAKLILRIETLENAIAQLDASAMRITAATGAKKDPKVTSLEVIAQARMRVSVEERAKEKRTAAQAKITKEETTRKQAETAVADARAVLAGWFKDQGAEDLEPTPRVAVLSERDRLRGTRKAHDELRTSARAGVNDELFAQELALLPNASRAAAVEQLLKDAQEDRDQAFAVHREAIRLYKEAFDADDQSNLTTEQATIIEEVRRGARRAAVARLGVLAAKGALRRLATERRTTMLGDVEKAFVAITAPAWSRVDVWSQSEGEKLIGVKPNGSSVSVEDMSTGTMGQLYFALRVAGYRSFARDLGPLPMILDDIMETFDDDRAKAALQLCSDIGQSGQAIIFTHHAHLVELARETIPGVNIVDMPS